MIFTSDKNRVWSESAPITGGHNTEQKHLRALARTMPGGTNWEGKAIYDFLTHWSNFAAWWVNINGDPLSPSLLETAKSGDAAAFRCDACQCWDRRLFITEQGYLGPGLQALRVGDSVYVICGGHTPFILRPKSDH